MTFWWECQYLTIQGMFGNLPECGIFALLSFLTLIFHGGKWLWLSVELGVMELWWKKCCSYGQLTSFPMVTNILPATISGALLPMTSKADKLPVEMQPVARDNNTSWTLKPGHQTFVASYNYWLWQVVFGVSLLILHEQYWAVAPAWLKVCYPSQSGKAWKTLRCDISFLIMSCH